jgi:uncharacterized ferritin-like protein (DUF455 family)
MQAFSHEERRRIAENLGDETMYNVDLLRQAIREAPEKAEFRKALVHAVASIEFAAIDSFSRKVCEWQDWDVPPSLIMALARQTWDEVRHAHLGKELVEHYGGRIGDYPDTLGGLDQAQQQFLRDPVVSLSATNVSLEGAGLNLFSGMKQLAAQVGDRLMEHCFDYNWADEVTHVLIGDYFVRQLCAGKPEEEEKALRAHALSEASRGNLTEEQRREIERLFGDEMQRGAAALSG